MTEGIGTDLFGNLKSFTCWYNKDDDFYYMENPVKNVYVFDLRQRCVNLAFRIVDSEWERASLVR